LVSVKDEVTQSMCYTTEQNKNRTTQNILRLDCIHIFPNPKFLDMPVFSNLQQQPRDHVVKACSKATKLRQKSTIKLVNYNR